MIDTKEIGKNKLRIFTCTPIDFRGDKSFFSRDSGLVCRGLQEIGFDSKAVMPGKPREDDEGDLIRTEYANLLDHEWWEKLSVAAVVFYAWGDPKYAPITRAIKKSGARVLLNLDTNGLISPIPSPLAFYQQTFSWACRMHGVVSGSVIGLLKCLRSSFPWAIDIPRLSHFESADAIAAVSPGARDLIKEHCRIYMHKNLSGRISCIPHPVSPNFIYDGKYKDNIVISIGRWKSSDSWQKDPKLLIKVLGIFLADRKDYKAVVVGAYDKIMEQELLKKHPEIRNRIILMGVQPNSQLPILLNKSKISLCVSFLESFHIASGESLCCGSSVVAPHSARLTSFPFLTSNGSGSLAESYKPEIIAATLIKEAALWDSGKRHAWEISRRWSSILHSPQVASEIVNALGCGL